VSAPEIIFDEVSKFYGEVLGVNRVSLRIPPGITSLVGPNGSGKTTLMNLMTGLVHPDRGSITVRGLSPRDPERLMRITGYATQYDAAPRGATGFDFVATSLLLWGYSSARSPPARRRSARTRRPDRGRPSQGRGLLERHAPARPPCAGRRARPRGARPR
jgi:ABC-type multidrug transport system ATPase subunit